MAPNNSFRNPVERIINIGLQAVGIMRDKSLMHLKHFLNQPNQWKTSGNLPQRRKALRMNTSPLCMSSPLELIKSTFSCLELKGKPVKSLESATEEDIERLFSKLITVDSTCTEIRHTEERSRKTQKASGVLGSLLCITFFLSGSVGQ